MSRAGDRPRQPDVTIDYGRPDPAGRRAWNHTRADVQLRIDGAIQFLGMAAAWAGGGRRVAFVLSLMLLAGGLGDCLAHGLSDGPELMAVGGGVLGFLLPLPRRQS